MIFINLNEQEKNTNRTIKWRKVRLLPQDLKNGCFKKTNKHFEQDYFQYFFIKKQNILNYNCEINLFKNNSS